MPRTANAVGECNMVIELVNSSDTVSIRQKLLEKQNKKMSRSDTQAPACSWRARLAMLKGSGIVSTGDGALLGSSFKSLHIIQ